MDTDAYLSRIGFSGTVRRDTSTLCRLQHCHLLTVPYENLDIMRAIPLPEEPDGLFEKIVTRRRGGYCFELNGLFGALLRDLGFEVTDCFARFLKGEPEIPIRRHRVLKVRTADGPVLCDAGIGMDCPVHPVRLDTYEVQSIGNQQYKITHDAFLGTVIHQCAGGEWTPFFAFTDEPQLNKDFTAVSYYCQTHPDSVFNKRDILAIGNKYGEKDALNGDILTYWDDNGKHKLTVTCAEQRLQIYSDRFGIKLQR